MCCPLDEVVCFQSVSELKKILIVRQIPNSSARSGTRTNDTSLDISSFLPVFSAQSGQQEVKGAGGAQLMMGYRSTGERERVWPGERVFYNFAPGNGAFWCPFRTILPSYPA